LTNPSPSPDAALFWFRRDLRVDDNAGLYHALRSARRVHAVFVFDREILDALPARTDRRVEFIHQSVVELDQRLREAGGGLVVRQAPARSEIPRLARQLAVGAVYANEDYEPAARARDAAVAADLRRAGIAFHTFKDTTVFAKDEVLTQAGKPYTVFTPYKRAWLAKLDAFYLKPYPVEKYLARLARPPGPPQVPSLADLGFEPTNLRALGVAGGARAAHALAADFATRIDRYDTARDYPALKGVSYLSVHNRFGTISVRALAAMAHHMRLARANKGAEVWLSELVWRDFYFQVLWHFPHAAERAFRPEYEAIRWENDPARFAAWCEGRTGYPIVDAAMRQLNQTGYMHNRLRMITASFLTKDLLIDWRWGEQYFAERLIDFDLAANNGGWQWAASTGCDAQPYFRIFNPVAQSERFDADGKFIRRYVPELNAVPDRFIHAPWTLAAVDQQAAACVIGRDYPAPIVDHAVQRIKALALYGRSRR
jgi:deoxyribodipyrimidine photo-lyase